MATSGSLGERPRIERSTALRTRTPVITPNGIFFEVPICGIGSKRALQALDRLIDAVLIVEDIGEVVPGRCEIRIGPDGCPIGGLRFEAALARTQHIPEVEWRCRTPGIHLH